MPKGRPTLYHYTIGRCAIEIEACGYLRTSPKEPIGRERPVVWFSANADYEHTARKPIWLPGTDKMRLLTVDEMDQQGGGVFRYVLPAEVDLDIKALAWPRLRDVAHMPPKVVGRMLAAAEQVGSRPAEWWGLFAPVPVHHLAVEQLRDNRWVPVSRPLQVEVDGRVITGVTLDEIGRNLPLKNYR